MEMVEQAKKGNIMDIKENFHIYHLNKTNMLIEEQKTNRDNQTQNEIFDIITNIRTQPRTCHNTQQI
jgi:hypothetical protein